MPLPIIDVPLYTIELPSTGEQIQFRPFLVKEQKILLMAQENDSVDAKYAAVKQIITNCTSGKLDPEKLSNLDVQYLFIQIRAKSVGETSDFTIECQNPECKTPVKAQINLEGIKVKKTEGHTKKIMLSSKVGVTMKYPSLSTERIYVDTNKKPSEKEYDIIIDCMENVFDESSVYPVKDTSREEMVKFIDGLSTDHYTKIEKFFETMPKLEETIVYKCPKCGKDGSITVNDFSDFFG